ncbi:Crp/Fnr family transcriptional regulator [Noviherbaspirillum cavernae]|uniref:Crp/Fnr family transcriptional regulator n=1 Tax=Noviherbaspirillum cavernae TaxID=2320862 RepID=UPI001314220E|nr:cyclic nucleotide-binding domain-containing protein [Noviherbaspirillum cavernae]
MNQSTLSQFGARFPQLAQELGQANLEMLLDGASIQEVAPERTVIRDRMPVDCIYFVLDGTLDVYIEQEGKSKKIATIKPGEWMGEISVLSGEFLASATIISNSPCKLLRVHHITFGKLITENETVAKVLLDHFIALMAQRFRKPLTHA